MFHDDVVRKARLVAQHETVKLLLLNPQANVAKHQGAIDSSGRSAT